MNETEFSDLHGKSEQKEANVHVGSVDCVAGASVEELIDKNNPPKDSINLGDLRNVKQQNENKNSDEIFKYNLQEEVDELMNHLIEINSNTKIREECIKRFTLEFLDANIEIEVLKLKLKNIFQI